MTTGGAKPPASGAPGPHFPDSSTPGLGISDFGISPGMPEHEGAFEAPAPHPRDPRVGLAAIMRRITSSVMGNILGDDDIVAAASVLEKVAQDLEGRARPGRPLRPPPDITGPPQEFFPSSPITGFANPLAPPVVVESFEGGLAGTAWFDYQYEGPPTCVHGGVIAMVFDEVLGVANIAAGRPCMTGTLTIRYLKPTPLRTTLRVEAHCTDQHGRKMYTRGGIYNGDVLTAEAEGVFIQLVPERFLEMVSHMAIPAEILEQVRADARILEQAPASPPEG
jgi:hypothetical protein